MLKTSCSIFPQFHNCSEGITGFSSNPPLEYFPGSSAKQSYGGGNYASQTKVEKKKIEVLHGANTKRAYKWNMQFQVDALKIQFIWFWKPRKPTFQPTTNAPTSIPVWVRLDGFLLSIRTIFRSEILKACFICEAKQSAKASLCPMSSSLYLQGACSASNRRFRA